MNSEDDAPVGDMLEDMLTAFSGISGMVGNYERRKVDKTVVGELTISTAFTDCGYETAICDATDHFHPVERYPSREAAVIGHKKWVEAAPTLTTVVKLGYGRTVKAKEITLQRKS